MKLHRLAAPAASLAALALVVTACAESERGSGEGDASGGTFTFGAAGAPEMFDPLYATDGETFRVTRQMFENLIGIEPGTAQMQPELAESWSSNEEGTVWEFKLRDDVTFHDGEKFDAEAVCTNLDRMYSQNAAGKIAAEYWGYTFGAFKGDAEKSLYVGCEAQDATTAVVTIDHATSSFPVMLSLPSLAMQSPKALEEGDANGIQQAGDGFTFPANAQNPVGTGPFKFEAYDEANGTIDLVRNDDYWGEAAKSAKLTFKVIPEESTRRQELQAGSIDGFDLPNPVDWAGLEEEGNQVEVRDPFNILYLGFNQKSNNPHLKKLEVRKALYHALNREQLVTSQLPEGATVATQFMPDTVSGYNSELEAYEYDPDKARQMLKDAGAEGMTLTFAYPTEVSRPYMPDPQTLYDALRTDLEAVGVKVDVQQASWNGGYLDNVTAGKYDAYLLGWTGDYDAAANFIGTFFGNLKENDFGTSATSWGKQLADDLAAADAIVDEEERQAAYEELNEQIMNDYLPGLPISHSPPALVVSGDVEGLIPSPLTAEEFSSVSVGGR